MRILYPIKLKSANSYFDDILNALSGIDYDCSPSLFFNSNNYYDIIHFQWPEELFNWEEPSDNQLNNLKKRMKYWKQVGTKIIYTKHNNIPHNGSHNFKEAYKIIEKSADGIIHLGNYSLLKSKNNISQKHIIIPHSLYENIDRNISQDEARKKLKLSTNKNYILCFGTIRNNEEYELLIKSFRGAKIKNKVLIISKWPILWGWRKNPLKRLKHELIKNFFNISKKYHIYNDNNNQINNNEVKMLFKSSDLVFIPRIKNLNSGILFMGYTFNKIVVGPAIGNIKEYLIATNNPTYNPKYIYSAINALEKGFLISKKENTINNYLYGIKNWSLKSSATKHLSFYKELLRRSV